VSLSGLVVLLSVAILLLGFSLWLSLPGCCNVLVNMLFVSLSGS